MGKPKQDDELSEAEAARRRDEALRRALGTKPKPHKAGENKKKGGGRRPSQVKR